jgi:hypothetical protein
MIRSATVCVNCDNLMPSMTCGKHKQSVELDNVCDDHHYKKSLTKDSSCNNCNHFKSSSCPNPTLAADGMLCFSWV